MKWLLLLLIAFTTHVMGKTFTFGVVPQQSATRLAQQWTPITDYLSNATGHQFVFSTAKDIPTFEEQLRLGSYDIAYMNPYHYTTFSSSPGYKAIAKAKDKQIHGIIVVRKDSGITSLEQLKDSTLAFPSPAAFAASILTRDHLIKAGVDFTPNYVSSHDSVYLSVARGFFPAGGGVIRTFKSLDKETRSQLKPIFQTEGYTPHAIAVHPRMDVDVLMLVQQALTELADTKQNQAILDTLKIKGFESATDSDWQDVRSLNINLLN
ncbi:phosphate/phosphite/phosphonate ABC transporter substrate-binding protein [Vibrio sp. TRT 21S02]|uniref:phosphate/phosphite/phosphonate ABC transporter substrate-binding protein n=1 Tax=Vibrio sp. TRT 21S02 TaxID=3418507 RepID=UPI003CEFE4E0